MGDTQTYQRGQLLLRSPRSRCVEPGASLVTSAHFFKRNWKCISFCEICVFFLNVGLSFLRAIMPGKEVTSVGHIEAMSTGFKP